MGRRSLIAAALAGAALLPATAHAGTYDVYSCAFGGNLYPNNAWVADGGYAGPPNGTVDTQCGTAAGDVISGALNPGISFAALGWAGLTLIPPSGTTISDFTVQVRHRYVDDTSDGTANNTAGLFRYGEGFFSGIGNLRAGDAAVLGPEGHWWGNGASPTDVTVTLSRRDSPSAMSLKGTEMILSSDCGNVAPCNMGPNDVQLEQILGLPRSSMSPTPRTPSSSPPRTTTARPRPMPAPAATTRVRAHAPTSRTRRSPRRRRWAVIARWSSVSRTPAARPR